MMTPTTHSYTVGVEKFTEQFREKFEGSVTDLESLFTMLSTDKGTVQQYGISGLGKPLSAGVMGEVHFQDMHQMGKVTFTMGTSTLGFMVPDQLDDDSQYVNFWSEGGQSMGQGFKFWKEYLMNLVLDRATNSSYTMYDGWCLSSASRTTLEGTAVSNLISTMTLNYQNMWVAAMYFEYGQLDQKDLPYKGTPATLLIHPRKLPDALKALGGDVEPDTLARNVQSLKSRYNINLKVNRLQTTTTNWALLGEGAKKDFIYYTRHEPRITKKETTTYHAKLVRGIYRAAAGARSGLNFLLIGS